MKKTNRFKKSIMGLTIAVLAVSPFSSAFAAEGNNGNHYGQVKDPIIEQLEKDGKKYEKRGELYVEKNHKVKKSELGSYMIGLVDSKEGQKFLKKNKIKYTMLNEDLGANIVLAEIDLAKAKELETNTDVIAYVEANEEVTSEAVYAVPPAHNTVIDSKGYFLHKLHKTGVSYQAGHTGTNVDVAIIDSGVDKDQPSVNNRVTQRLITAESSTAIAANPAIGSVSDDIGGHGTLVASGVVGKDSAGYPIGTAPDANIISIVAVTGIDSKGRHVATSSSLTQGINLAVASGAEVINVSYTLSSNTSRANAGLQALKAGAIVFNSAGNTGEHSTTSQTICKTEGTMCVGAVGSDGKDSNWGYTSEGVLQTSGYGAGVDFAGAGGGNGTYFQAVRNYGMGYGSGTSFASPVLAGQYAAYKSAVFLASPDQITDHMKNTANLTQIDNGNISGVVKTMGSNKAGYGLIPEYSAIESNDFIVKQMNSSGTVLQTITATGLQTSGVSLINNLNSTSTKYSADIILDNIVTASNVNITKAYLKDLNTLTQYPLTGYTQSSIFGALRLSNAKLASAAAFTSGSLANPAKIALVVEFDYTINGVVEKGRATSGTYRINPLIAN